MINKLEILKHKLSGHDAFTLVTSLSADDGIWPTSPFVFAEHQHRPILSSIEKHGLLFLPSRS